MKGRVLPLALLSLLGSAAAQHAGEHGHHHAHLHRRRGGSFAARGDQNHITVTDPQATTTVEVPEVIVYVDEHGQPFRTATEMVRIVPPSSFVAPPPSSSSSSSNSSSSSSSHGSTLPAPSSSAPAAVKTDVDAVAAAAPSSSNTPEPTPAPQSSAAPAAADTGEASTAPAVPSSVQATPVVAPAAASSGGSSDDASSSLPGVTYSPYNSDGSCKTAPQVMSDLEALKGLYSMVRIYGVDCDQVATVVPAAKAIGVKVFLGIFNLDDLDGQIGTLVQAVGAHGGWAPTMTVSVGNELVNNGQASAAQVLAAVGAARQSLRSAGYQGPVVTVDTFVAVQQNPELCDESDYCAMNVHPFFDPNTAAEQAGDFVEAQVAKTRALLADQGQRVVVTETGWPWQGNANGNAVPGRANQQAAVQSLTSAFGSKNPGGLFLFNAYNDGWKKAEAATFYAEPFWGLH